MIDGPTRVIQTTETKIDLMFASNPDRILSFGVNELGLSDHYMIYGLLNVGIEKQIPCMHEIRVFGRCDVETLTGELISAPWSVMDVLDDVDSKWDFWKKQFFEVVDSHIPVKKVRVKRNSLPWIDWELRKLMRLRNYQCRKAKKSKDENDW